MYLLHITVPHHILLYYTLQLYDTHISSKNTHYSVCFMCYTHYCRGLYRGVFTRVRLTRVKTSCSNRRGGDEKIEQIGPRPCRHPGAGPNAYTPPPHRGSPVLSHPATVPSQMPLRRVVSHSERFLEPGQCRTLRRGLEAVYGPYGTSAPLRALRDDRRRQEM